MGQLPYAPHIVMWGAPLGIAEGIPTNHQGFSHLRLSGKQTQEPTGETHFLVSPQNMRLTQRVYLLLESGDIFKNKSVIYITIKLL